MPRLRSRVRDPSFARKLTLEFVFKPKCPGGGIGRHAGLKILCLRGRTGSSPVWGTPKASHFYERLFCFYDIMFNLQIIYEDDVLLVCNKPAGLMVEPDRNNHPNLLQQVKNYLKETTGDKNPYVQHLHRLDRVTSGIVLFTKQKEYLRNLSEQFAQRQVSKYYKALTDKAPVTSSTSVNDGVLEHWHRKEKKKAELVPEGAEYAEKAKLEYNVKTQGNYFIWNIQLHTGKYHQIRVQLASIDCPILGDELYGSNILYKPNAIALHAAKLIIKHPASGEEMVFEAPNSDFESLSHR